MKLPTTLKKMPGQDIYVNDAEDIINDFTNYKEVKVRVADPSMVGSQANCCIDNSLALAEYDDLDIIQGYISLIENPNLGIFHYWNYCPDQNVYWDSTPLPNKFRYFIKEDSARCLW